MNSTMMFVRSLGSRRLAQIVLAFLAVRGPLDVDEVCLWTGLNREAAGLGLSELKGMGVLGCQSLAHNRKVWLPGALLLIPFTGEENVQLSGFPSSGSDVVDAVSFSDEVASIATTTTTTRGQLSAFPSSGKNVPLNQFDVDRLAALAVAGIHGKKAKALLRHSWVTVEFIEAHWAWVQSEGDRWDNPQGMMIDRIEGEVPPPPVTPSLPGPGRFSVRSWDLGKKGTEVRSFTWDVEQSIADYMGHPKGCSCVECGFILAANGDCSVVCPDCKSHNCVCKEA